MTRTLWAIVDGDMLLSYRINKMGIDGEIVPCVCVNRDSATEMLHGVKKMCPRARIVEFRRVRKMRGLAKCEKRRKERGVR